MTEMNVNNRTARNSDADETFSSACVIRSKWCPGLWTGNSTRALDTTQEQIQ